MTDKAKLKNALKRLACACRSAARLAYALRESDVEIELLLACANVEKAKQKLKEETK